MAEPSQSPSANLNPTEKYLERVANLNFETQYLSNTAVVEPKCFIGRLVRYIPVLSGLFRYFFGTNIVKVRAAFVERMNAYEKEVSELPRERRISLVKSAQAKFNDLIGYINSKREVADKVPNTEIFDLQIVDVRWKRPKQTAGDSSQPGMASFPPPAQYAPSSPQLLTSSLPPLLSSMVSPPPKDSSTSGDAKGDKKDK